MDKREHKATDSGPRVVQAAYDLVIWSAPAIGKFPRSYRFTLGERMERRLYDILEDLIAARYAARSKPEILSRVNLSLDVFRYQTRIARDLKAMGLKQYEHANRLVDDVRHQVGGWLKSAKERKP